MSSTTRLVALDWLNFSLADVRGVFGPYLGVYLLTVQRWDQARIGMLMTLSGLLGLLVQTPVGAFVDATRFKRATVVVGVTGLGLGACAIPWARSFERMLFVTGAIEVAGALLPVAVAALTLAITAPSELARRFGRNGAFDHGGSVFIAIVAALVAALGSQRAVFYLVPPCAILATASVLAIPTSSIDYRRARGLERQLTNVALELVDTPVKSRPLMAFAACAALFHFANAPMLPLVGQELALANRGQEAQLVSVCIVAAQVVMMLCSTWAGRTAQRYGNRPVLLLAFAVLTLRGLLYTLSEQTWWLLSVQLLDGVGAGIFGVLVPLALVDLTRGSGRYNVAFGLVAMGQGIGASLSNAFAGVIVVHYGYPAAFTALAAVAMLGFALLIAAIPNSRRVELTPVSP